MLTRKVGNFIHLLNVSKLENSRKGDKSIWHILPPLTSTNLRALQEVSMIYCYKRKHVCIGLDKSQPCSPWACFSIKYAHLQDYSCRYIRIIWRQEFSRANRLQKSRSRRTELKRFIFSNWFVLSWFYVEINKFINVSCTDCFSEAVVHIL